MRGSWRECFGRRASRRRRCGADSPAEERRRALADLAAGGSTSSSPSTCSTRASTYRRSTRCCCCGRPTARRCSCSSSDAGCGDSTARRSAPCSISSGTIARSSGSIVASGAARGKPEGCRKQIEEGFPFLPAGCHIELDRVATRIVLENIRAGGALSLDGEGRRAATDWPKRRRHDLARVPRRDRARTRGRLRRLGSHGRISALKRVSSVQSRRAPRGATATGLRPAAAHRRLHTNRDIPRLLRRETPGSGVFVTT